MPARAVIQVMVAVTALITAELLILSSIHYLIAAFKTAGRVIFLSVSIIHVNVFKIQISRTERHETSPWC